MADTFLRSADVSRITGVPRSTRCEMIERGEFPKPIKISVRIVAWSATEIERWQKAHIALRDGKELEA